MSIQKALTVFKSLNGLAPEYLTSKFLSRNESNYALRESVNKLVVPLLLLFSRTAAQNFWTAYPVTLESHHSKKSLIFANLFIFVSEGPCYFVRVIQVGQLVKLHTLHVYTVEDYNHGKVIREGAYSAFLYTRWSRDCSSVEWEPTFVGFHISTPKEATKVASETTD